ncbi:uncharacterized protein LOC107604675 [Arachis ipaensis]|uniref:uncharacterized protein LOC107604675 n=1 Tax=Arachis ipaensis TaxID=130454 RepID=UPI000A2B68AA|nr:uncharacterized protein LOC107604675 [Arachis ipaensis]
MPENQETLFAAEKKKLKEEQQRNYIALCFPQQAMMKTIFSRIRGISSAESVGQTRIRIGRFEQNDTVLRLRGNQRSQTASYPSPSLFLPANTASLNQGKNPSRHHRRKEEPSLPPSVAVRGLSPRVFVRRNQGSFFQVFNLFAVTSHRRATSPSKSVAIILSPLSVAICRSQGFVSSSLRASQLGEFSKSSICLQSPSQAHRFFLMLGGRHLVVVFCRHPSSSAIEDGNNDSKGLQ